MRWSSRLSQRSNSAPPNKLSSAVVGRRLRLNADPLDGTEENPVTERQFHIAVMAVASGFTALFALLVLPPLIEDPDIVGAFAAGFVNPYSSGYSADVIACWFILAAWVVFEAKSKGVRHGWLCLLIGVIPGVAVGLAAYLVVRSRQLVTNAKQLGGAPSNKPLQPTG